MRGVNVDFQKYNKIMDQTLYKKKGRVVNVVGLTIESAGPDAKLGDICEILSEGEERHAIPAEVVGFKDRKTLLMPYGSVEGIGAGCLVENTGLPLQVAWATGSWAGRWTDWGILWTAASLRECPTWWRPCPRIL